MEEIRSFNSYLIEKKERELGEPVTQNKNAAEILGKFSEAHKKWYRVERVMQNHENDNAYNYAVECLLLRGYFNGNTYKLEDYTQRVVDLYAERIGVISPKIGICRNVFCGDGKVHLGEASVTNEIRLNLNSDEGIDKYLQNKSNNIVRIAGIRDLQTRFDEIFYANRDYLLNNVASFLGVLFHEMQHIKQYSYTNDYYSGKECTPSQKVMIANTFMYQANLEADKKSAIKLREGKGYLYTISEVDARLSSIKELIRLYERANLCKEARLKIFEAIRSAIYNEINRQIYYGDDYLTLVKNQLLKSRDLFEDNFGETEMGYEFLNKFDALMKNKFTFTRISGLSKSFKENAIRYDKIEDKTDISAMLHFPTRYNMKELEMI